jgi:hypothetical protein
MIRSIIKPIGYEPFNAQKTYHYWAFYTHDKTVLEPWYAKAEPIHKDVEHVNIHAYRHVTVGILYVKHLKVEDVAKILPNVTLYRPSHDEVVNFQIKKENKFGRLQGNYYGNVVHLRYDQQYVSGRVNRVSTTMGKKDPPILDKQTREFAEIYWRRGDWKPQKPDCPVCLDLS